LLDPFRNALLVHVVERRYKGGTRRTATTSTYANTDSNWTHFDGKLILTNCTDNVKQWSGSVLSNLSAGAPIGKYIALSTSRGYIAHRDEISVLLIPGEEILDKLREQWNVPYL